MIGDWCTATVKRSPASRRPEMGIVDEVMAW
jgi:hypothetical protein